MGTTATPWPTFFSPVDVSIGMNPAGVGTTDVAITDYSTVSFQSIGMLEKSED